METYQSELAQWINGHDVASPFKPVLSIDAETITVQCWEHGPDGGWKLVQETIPATVKAARDWLGY